MTSVFQNTGQSTPKPPRELLFKVLVVGEFGVGKTAIIRRYCEGAFSFNYKVTIGVDFALKTLEWDENTKINLQLWDIAGHERFGSMTRVYYKYAMAAVIVFDLSRPVTFFSVPKWYDDLISKVELPDQRPLPVILLANKCDLPVADDFNMDSVTDFVASHRLVGCFATSAKDDVNIDAAVEKLVDHILVSRRSSIPNTASNGVLLGEEASERARPEAAVGRCCR
ncbi:unnamed protein product [Notodromas monacha]|uniref:Ras-related protein Rab n=1 Tax=Notodromas monacha TaxID=399045 RepID=A0A7R9BQ40_9CRUS|nr:unnamed protein product [Notodromas monacha]CAG0918761.1 unnamed protein product [Notodromas monacha]